MALQRASSISDRRPSYSSSIEQLIAERGVRPVFQPIVDLVTGDILAVEALARGPAGSPLEFPDALFAAAIEAGLLTELDQLCCARALEVARDAGPVTPPLVFVNAEPAGLTRPMSGELQAVVYGGLPFRIVLEFTERALTSHPGELLHVADLVHRAGNAVALDDVGADPASLAFLPLVEPEVVKLDMHLLRDPYSAATHAIAGSVSAYADRTGATVLAEGVETTDDAVNALALGARWGQGWLFGRPGPLAALEGRQHGTEAVRLGQSALPPSQARDTPFAIASRRHPVRAAGPEMTDALIDRVLGTVAVHGRGGVVVSAVNEPGGPSRWLPRLIAAGRDSTFFGVLSGRPLPGVLTAEPLAADDPVRAETIIAVLSENVFAVLCLRAAPHGCELVYSQDRQVVQTVVRDLMSRLRRW